MKTLKRPARFSPATALFLWLAATSVHAVVPFPGNPPPWLESWTFNDPDTLMTFRGYLPLSFTNLSVSDLGDYWAVVLDDTNGPAWLNYNITEADGTNQLRVDRVSWRWFGLARIRTPGISSATASLRRPPPTNSK